MRKLLVLGLFTLFPLAMQSAPPIAVFIQNAHIVPASGPDLPKASVLLRDGLIEDVGPDLTAPPDAWVIDGTGLTVYPGFIDGLSTWGIPVPAASAERSAQPAAGAAPAAPRPHGPEDRPQTYAFERAADLVSPGDARLEMARAAGYTTAATFPDHGIVEGLGAMIDLAGERGRGMVVAQPIGEQILLRRAGFRSGFPNSLMGDIAYVRQLYLDLNQYQQAQAVYKNHAAGNPRPEYDHNLEGLAESPRLLLPAEQVQQIDRMLAFGRELGVPFVVYGLREAFLRVDELKQANVPLLVSLKWPVAPKDDDPANVPDYRDLVMRDRSPAVPGLLAKAGVTFAFYSDGIATAPDLKKAVKKAIDAGLPAAEAIRALTINAAAVYGLSDRLGSIEKGKIANLVISKGDIFDDKSTIDYVFIDGQEYRPPEEEQKPPAHPGPNEQKPVLLGDAE